MKIAILLDVLRDVESKFMLINNITAMTESIEDFDYSELNIDREVYTGDTPYDSFVNAYHLDLLGYSDVRQGNEKYYLDELNKDNEIYLIDISPFNYSYASKFFTAKFLLNSKGFIVYETFEDFNKDSEDYDLVFSTKDYNCNNTQFEITKNIKQIYERCVETNN